MEIRPFRVYSAADCSAIAAVLEERLAPWVQRWFGQAAVRVQVRNVNGSDDALLLALDDSGDDSDTVVWTTSQMIAAVAAVGQAVSRMLGAPAAYHSAAAGGWQDVPDRLSACDDRLVEGLAGDCLRGMCTSLAGDGLDAALPDVSNQTPGEAPGIERWFTRGGGAAVLKICLDDLEFSVVLDPRLLAPVAPAPKPRKLGGLAPVMPLVGDAPIRLRAELGVTMLTIGDLERLAVGDVLTLDQTIDTDPELRTDAGVSVARGRLGRKGKCKAMQVY